MKEEILKIMEMNKKGTLSDEQAAELLESLKSDSEEASDEKPHDKENSTNGESKKGFDLSELGGLVSELVNVSLEGAMGEVREAIKDVKGSFKKGSVNVKVDGLNSSVTPSGSGFVYEDNEYQVSHVEGLELIDCQMCDNKFQASKVTNLSIDGGHLLDCQFQGSSTDGLALIRSELNDANFQGTKVSKTSIVGSTIRDTYFKGLALKSLEVIDSQWKDSEFQGVSIAHTSFVNTVLEDTIVKGTSFKGSSLDSVSFKDCELKDLKFVDCKISNINLKDEVLKSAKLEGLEIDGNEALLKALS